MNEPGMTTRDMRTLGKPNPAERGLSPDDLEDRTQRHGRICRRTGITIIIGVFVGSLAAVILSEKRVFNEPGAQALANLSLFSILVGASIITNSGFYERRERPMRAMMRQALRQLENNTERLDTLVSVPGRLAALEAVIDKVPGYGQGVMDGAQVMSDALGPDTDRD